MSNGNGHRWSKFWWQDHQGDAALRSCSLAARGYWVEMLCIMHAAAPVGHLLINGRQPTTRQMAAICGCTEKEAKSYAAELEAAGVFSRIADGTILCRRMVRDTAASDAGREHIAKRWEAPKTTDPPNRGANREPTREPTRKPNGGATSFPTSPPITQKLEADSELEAEEKKVSNYTHLLTTSPASARAVEACEAPPAGTYGDPAIQIAAQTIVEKLGRNFESSAKNPPGKPPKRSALIQAAAVLRGPLFIDDDVLIEDEPLGAPPRRGPCDPQRTVVEQYAGVLGISLAEAATRLGVAA